MSTNFQCKRLICLVMVLCMVIGMMPVHVHAAANGAAVDAAIIFSDLHTSSSDYKESTVKGIMTAFKNAGLPVSSVTSGGDAFSVNDDSTKYTGDPTKLTGYIQNVLGNVPVNYVWSDHDRYGTGIDKKSRLVYGAGADGIYGTDDDGNYYVYTLSMGDLCTYDRYTAGFNYTASSNNRASKGFTATVPEAIKNFKDAAATLKKDRPLLIVSHQPLFDNRNDNGWAADWCDAINEVATGMDVAFFYGHNHKYDSGSDYYYAKGSTMPVATRKLTNGADWNYAYQTGSGWQYNNDLASVNKVLNFTHMCAGYLAPSSTGSTSGTTREGTAMAVTIYEDSIRFTTYNSKGIFTGNYAVDKTITRDFAVSQPQEPTVPSEPAVTEPTVPSEPAVTEPTAPSEPEATEPPVSDEVESEKVYVLVDAPVDGGKYLIVNQTLTNGDLSKDWDTDDDGMAVIRNGEGISYSYAVPKAGTITDASGKVYTKGYIEYTDENAVWTVHASGKAWTIENDGYYLNKGSDNGVTASKSSLTWNYTANGDDSRLYNGSDYLYFTYYGGERDSWRWRTGTESGTSSTRDIFFYQEVVLTAPETTPDFTPDSNDVVVGDADYSFVKVTAAPLQEGYYRLQNNHTSKYLTNTKTNNANRLNLDANGQNHVWYIKAVSGGYTVQYGGPNGEYLTFSHEKAAMSKTAQTVQILTTNGYWGIGATSGNPVAYLAREGTNSSSTSVHGYASNDYKYPGDVGMDWNLYQRVENRITYSVSASDVHHYLGQNDNQAQLIYALLANGAAGNLPAGGKWTFSTAQDAAGIIKTISANGVITFNEIEGSCYVKVAYTWGAGTAYTYVKVTAEVDPNACDHRYMAVTVEATCTQDGSVTYTCACGDSYVEVIPAAGHDYKAVVTAPTCTVGGYTTYTCATCGDAYTANETAAVGHDYNVTTVAATCLKDGSVTYTCACGHRYIEVIPATGHAYVSVVTAPTCIAEGYTTNTCACGDWYFSDYTAALGHSYDTVTVNATCTTAGSVTYTCHCGHSYAESIPALGHDYVSVVTAPTCTADGYTTNTCATCGDWYLSDATAALGHHYDIITVAPTCTEGGYTARACVVCGEGDVYDKTDALGHDYVIVTVEVTCTTDGYTTHTCSTCGDSYVTDLVAAQGHDYVSTTVEATCTVDGSITYTCGCGDTYIEVIPALGHDYASVVTVPTCTEGGYTTNTCACGDWYFSDYIDALGHSYETVTVEATCTTDGSVTYTCACGDAYTDVIAAKGHDHKAVVTAPTCTESGYTTYTCACGDTYVADEVYAKGHDHRAIVTKPTCTESGYTTYTCRTCGDTYVSDETAALGHSYNMVTVEATCTEDGYTTYTCACGDTYIADRIEATGHIYNTVVTAPTDKEGGYTTYTCVSCGFSFVGDQTESLENSLVAGGNTYEEKTVYVRVDAFENGGKYLLIGEDGPANANPNPIAYLNNNGNEGKQIVTIKKDTVTSGSTTYTKGYIELNNSQAVWTASGSSAKGFTLSNNGKYIGGDTGNTVRGSASEALAVVYDASAVRLKTASGTTKYLYYSTYSGEDWKWSTSIDSSSSSRQVWIYKEMTVRIPTSTSVTYTMEAQDMTHVLSTETAQLQYTLLADGVKCGLPSGGQYTFSVRNDVDGIIAKISDTGVITFTGVVGTCDVKIACTWGAGTVYKYVNVTTQIDPNACDHDYTIVTVEATCTTAGSASYSCSICQKAFTETIPALGHDYTSVVIVPTCTTGGYTTNTCGTCGHCDISDETAALGHSYETVTVAATCTEHGSVAYTCCCGDAYTEVVPVLGHDYVSKVTASTCTEGGYTTYTCRACGNTYVTDETYAKGHDHRAIVTAPTCTEGGYTTYTCRSCGDTYVADETAALGHSYNVVTVEATCTEDGYTTYTCRCGDAYIADVVAAKGHDYASVVTMPTCTEGGHTTYTCICGDSYIQDEVAALGHHYNAEVTAPTCTKDGYTTHTCSNCGDSYTTDRVAALGHQYVCTEGEGCLIYTCACGDTYMEATVSEWVKLGKSYVLDTDGINVGAQHKYIVVGGSKDYALTLNNGTISAANVKIQNNTIVLDNASAYEFYFSDNGSKERNTYLLTQDGSRSVYHASSNINYGHDSKGYWYFGSSSNGSYQLYDYDNCNWYLNYGYAWGTDSVNRFAVSYNTQYVRLFKLTDSYVRLAGSVYQTVTDADGATAASVLKKLSLESSVDGVNVSGTSAVTADMVAWDNGFNGAVPGIYTATVTKDGVQIGTIKVTVTSKHIYESVVTAPTCTQEGYTTHICVACGYSYVDKKVAALGHSYVCSEGEGCLIYTCICGDTFTEMISSQWMKVSGAYVLDTDGIDVGAEHKYIVVGSNQDYALTLSGSTVGSAKVTIQNNRIVLNDASAYEFYFARNNKESNTYLLTRDGTKTIYHANGKMYYGNDNKGYWYFGSQSNGSYQLYDYDSCNWYLNYGYVWGSDSTNGFAVSYNSRSVRLFKYTEAYARLDGALCQFVTAADGATVKSILNQLSVNTSEDGVNVSGTAAVTADMVSWDQTFDGTTPGVYTATVTYDGIQLGTVKVIVTAANAA